eukprot:365322-Chlamydomonas_euryale.AAC.3
MQSAPTTSPNRCHQHPSPFPTQAISTHHPTKQMPSAPITPRNTSHHLQHGVQLKRHLRPRGAVGHQAVLPRLLEPPLQEDVRLQLVQALSTQTARPHITQRHYVRAPCGESKRALGWGIGNLRV